MATNTEDRTGSTLDPTPRTMEQILLLIKAMEEKFAVTFDGYDKAIRLLQDFADKQPTTSDVAGELRGLRELMFEKFASVKSQFDQADKALTAALNAAEKAVKEQNTSNTTAIDKSEKGFKELLNALGSRVDAVEKASEGKITDVKESINKIDTRITTIESSTNGAREKSKDNSALTFSIIGVALGIISAVGVVVAIVIALKP